MKEYEVVFELRFTNTIFIEAESQDEATQAVQDHVFDDYKVLFDGETMDFDDVLIVEVN